MQDLAYSNGSCEYKVITSGKPVYIYMYIYIYTYMLQTWYVKFANTPDPILAVAINAMNKSMYFFE